MSVTDITYSELPNIDTNEFSIPNSASLKPDSGTHKPRILLLYGSLRERSFSRLAIEESARLLHRMARTLKSLIRRAYRNQIRMTDLTLRSKNYAN